MGTGPASGDSRVIERMGPVQADAKVVARVTTHRGRDRFIDCDVHQHLPSLSVLATYLPREWRRYVTDVGYSGPFLFPYAPMSVAGVAMAEAQLPDGAPAGSSYSVLCEQLLDKYDVELAILTNNFDPASMRVQPELQAALAAAHNDWTMDAWLGRDSRLRGTICIPPEPDAAVREIERVARCPQMVQVLLPVVPWEWGDPMYHALFEVAERHGLVVAFHVTPEARTAVGLPRYYVSWHSSYPQNYMSQLVGLVFNGVFAKCPGTRVVFLEGGWTWLPHLTWRMDRDWRSLRVEVPWVTRRPSDYVHEHVWFGTQPLDEPDDSNHLVDVMTMSRLEERLVFATDYPHWDFDEPGRVLPRAISAEVRHAIFRQNALQLYSQRL